jgi:hypothetical protein
MEFVEDVTLSRLYIESRLLQLSQFRVTLWKVSYGMYEGSQSAVYQPQTQNRGDQKHKATSPTLQKRDQIIRM